jgi:hypothetical protein
MFKLAAKSRARWPTSDEMPTAGARPGIVPNPA